MLFFFATKSECELILRELRQKSEFSIKSIPFLKGKLRDNEILICLTGIGKVNASIAATIAFQNLKIKGAIVSGIGGAYPSSGLNVGDIVLAKKEINADEGLLINCEEKENSFLFINSEEINLIIPNLWNNIISGNYLTVSSCTGNYRRALFLEKKFNAICENMEGFAIAKAAKIYEVPVTEVRSISNIATARDRFLTIDEVNKASLIIQEFLLDSFSMVEF